MKTNDLELAARVCWRTLLKSTPQTELYIRRFQLFELYTEKLAMAQKPELWAMAQHERKER